MLTVVWSATAFRDVDAIADYISRDNPVAADRVSDRIFEAAADLGVYPRQYRSGREPGTREMVVLPNYLMVYRIDLDSIRILRVLHASQRYP